MRSIVGFELLLSPSFVEQYVSQLITHATGVIVDGFVRQEDGALIYTGQHYEGNEPGPQASRYVCHAAMVTVDADRQPLRVLPERAAAERP